MLQLKDALCCDCESGDLGGFHVLSARVCGAGALPAQWSTLSLTTLAIDRNSLTGMIPASWGTSGSLGQLSTLQMAGNLLNGTIPEM